MIWSEPRLKVPAELVTKESITPASMPASAIFTTSFNDDETTTGGGWFCIAGSDAAELSACASAARLGWAGSAFVVPGAGESAAGGLAVLVGFVTPLNSSVRTPVT